MVRAAEWLGVALNLAYTYLYLQGTLPLAYVFAAAGGLAMGWACWHHRLQAETAHTYPNLNKQVGTVQT